MNARISPRSARRLRWLGRYMASLMERFDRILAQDTEVAERFRALGVPAERIEVTGSERRLKSNFIRGILELPVRLHRI